MDSEPPGSFYTGIVAEMYAPLRSSRPDPDAYERFIRRSGEPALELGCGDGDPLLDLRAQGLDVDGLDSSADMLDRCRAAAAARQLDVTLYCQLMEEMELDRRYRTIFVAGPTFNLLPDDAAAGRALAAIRDHLDTGGSALIPLFVPSPTPADGFGAPREHTTPDGTVMRFEMVSEARDEDARTQTTILRYELRTGERSTVVERPWLLHWYTQTGFRELVADAGLTVASTRSPQGGPAEPDATSAVFILGTSTPPDGFRGGADHRARPPVIPGSPRPPSRR